MKVKLYSLTADPSTITVSSDIFEGKVNTELLAQALHVYRSNQRQSGAKAIGRGEVNRTTAKWFRQKGTGRARHGARSAPIFVGGGSAHGPSGEENWKRTLPASMKKKAVISALSGSAEAKAVSVITDLETISGKTADARNLMNTLRQEKDNKVLIVIDNSHDVVIRSFRNLDNVSVTRADRLHPIEVITADQVIIMKPALAVLEALLIKKVEKKA